MKKKLYILFILLLGTLFVTACNEKAAYENQSTRTIEDLLEEYVESVTKADVDLAKDIYAPFYVEIVKSTMTKEKYEEKLKKYKELYGEDFNITYEVKDKVKYTGEELVEFNERMAIRYNSKDKATECYKIDGTITVKGSIKEESDTLEKIAYCKYNDSWFIVGI